MLETMQAATQPALVPAHLQLKAGDPFRRYGYRVFHHRAVEEYTGLRTRFQSYLEARLKAFAPAATMAGAVGTTVSFSHIWLATSLASIAARLRFSEFVEMFMTRASRPNSPSRPTEKMSSAIMHSISAMPR